MPTTRAAITAAGEPAHDTDEEHVETLVRQHHPGSESEQEGGQHGDPDDGELVGAGRLVGPSALEVRPAVLHDE
jgi:hypothetical protein